MVHYPGGAQFVLQQLWALERQAHLSEGVFLQSSQQTTAWGHSQNGYCTDLHLLIDNAFASSQ